MAASGASLARQALGSHLPTSRQVAHESSTVKTAFAIRPVASALLPESCGRVLAAAQISPRESRRLQGVVDPLTGEVAAIHGRDPAVASGHAKPLAGVADGDATGPGDFLGGPSACGDRLDDPREIRRQFRAVSDRLQVPRRASARGTLRVRSTTRTRWPRQLQGSGRYPLGGTPLCWVGGPAGGPLSHWRGRSPLPLSGYIIRAISRTNRW